MGHPVFADIEPSVGEDSFCRCLVDVVQPLLVVDFICAENAETRPQGNDSGRRCRSRNCRRRVFLDACLYEIIGTCLCKTVNFNRSRQVAVKDYYRSASIFFVIEFAYLGQGFSECAPVVLFVVFRICQRSPRIQVRYAHLHLASFGKISLSDLERLLEHLHICAEFTECRSKIFA